MKHPLFSFNSTLPSGVRQQHRTPPLASWGKFGAAMIAAAAMWLGAATSAQAIPTDSLIHYDFNSVSGTTVTNTGSLGSAANGTLANASLVTGQFGNALSFTGGGSGVRTNAAVAIGNAFTFACWVSTTSGNTSYSRIIMNSYQSSGYLGSNNAGKYLTIVKDQFVHSTTSIDTTGAWHHLAMTWDGTAQRFYYDGSLVSTTNQTGPTTLTSQLGFGCNSGAYSESWNGKMDDAFVFGRALSLAEVQSLYLNAPNAIPAVPTGLTATPTNSGTIRLNWTAVPEAVSYNAWIRNTVTSVEQVLSASASPFTVTGLTNGTPYEFKVSATNSLGTSAYSAIVTATPTVGTEKDILTFAFPGLPSGIISGTSISVTVPVVTVVTSLTPTYTVSPLANGSPASGTPRDFTNPQTYTVTAEDGSTKIFTVTVTPGAVPSVFTWNTAAAGNWSDSSKWTNDLANGTGLIASGANYYTLNFNLAGTYTATQNLNAGFVVNKINFGGGATLGGNSLALTADGATLPTIHQNSTNAVSINTPISLTANTTLGGTSTGNVTFGGNITGAGSLTKSNGGTLTLNGTNSYTGGTVISAGTVMCSLSNPSPLGGAGSINVTVQSGAAVAFNRNQLTGTLTLNGGSVFTGNGWGDDAWSGSIVLGATSIVDVGGTDGSFHIHAVVSGPGGLIKRGPTSKPMPLNAANTFTGPVSVQAGALKVISFNSVSGGTASSSLGAPTTVADGTIALGATSVTGRLHYTGPGETTDRVLKLAGTTGGATLTLAGTSNGIPTTRGEIGLLKFTSDVSNPGTAGVDNRKTLTLNQESSSATGTNTGRGELSGSIGDSVLGTAGQLATSVTKSGVGIWTLSGSNTYTGTTRVQAGTLVFARALSLGSGTLDITTGAKAQIDYIGTRQISALTFDAGTARPNGTYGSSLSLATNKDDTRFSGLGTVTIGPITNPTTTSLVRTTGSEPSNGGDTLTFTATVAGTAPTGNVQFYDGITLIGTQALNGSSQATLTTSVLASAVHTISALYVGNAGNAPSSAALTQTVLETRVLATTTTLALTSGGNPSAYGAAVTFTATVAGSTPTGSVMFFNGTTELGTGTLNGSGQATFTTNNLAVGFRPISARYLGDATRLPSTSTPTLFHTVSPPTGNNRLKVFILAGQSNMVGKGRVETGRNPNNLTSVSMIGGLGSLRNMLNRSPEKYGYLADPTAPTPQGNPGWMKRSDVWVTYTGETELNNPAISGLNPRRGILDADFGDLGGQGRIGPEYGFGLVTGSQIAEPVLLIKIAWGGKSLIADFRPPSSGGTLGPYYTLMINRVHYVLNNLATEYPAYTGGGYDLVGFGWHQGWNDIGQATVTYETNLTNLINDIRTEFAVPNLPFVVGGSGMANGAAGNIFTAQMNVGNPALHPEFTGNVTSVDTRPFDYGELMGSSAEGVHWNWSAESYFNVGESMGQAMMALLPSLSSAKDILTFDFPGQPAATISGTNISVTVPYGTSVTALAPTFTLSPLATASPVSGTARNFATAQTYTITAQDLTTQVFTVTVTVAPSPFSTWASNPAQGLTAGVNDGPLDDPDRDGISNLLEFTLSGAPMVTSQAILPALTSSGGNWIFEYDRSDLSQSSTTQTVEYGSDLTGWTPVPIPATTAGNVTITPGTPTDHVAVTIPFTGTKVFARLKVAK